MKLKKNQAVSDKPTKVGKEKLQKANDDDGDAESDTQEYLKVSATPNKKPKIPAPEADSEEDDLDVDDEELDDEDDDFGEEGSLDDEELDDEESDGLSGDDDGEVPQLVAAGKAKAKQKLGTKDEAIELSDDDDDDDGGNEEDDDDSNLEDEEEEEEDDEEDEEDEGEEVAATKTKKPSKDSGSKGQQAKRKADDGPIEQTSKKTKQGDGIPWSIYMDADEFDKLFLYVGNLPEGCTIADVKALSPDIIGVRTNVKCKKLSSVFVEFRSEEVAERNLKRLQAAKLQGHPLKVGYRGAKRADCPLGWQEVQNELCVYGLPQGLPKHRVARLFPTATEVTTMAFYTLVVFEDKEALLDALKKEACHSIDGCSLQFCYHLKPDATYETKKTRKKRKHGKLLDSKPGMNSKGALGKKHLKEGISNRSGNKLFQNKPGGAANAKTSKARFDAKRNEVKKLAAAAAARRRKIENEVVK